MKKIKRGVEEELGDPTWICSCNGQTGIHFVQMVFV